MKSDPPLPLFLYEIVCIHIEIADFLIADFEFVRRGEGEKYAVHCILIKVSISSTFNWEE